MEDELMRYMLLQSYGASGSDCPPISEWAPEEIRAHIEFQHVLNAELLERGELIDAQGLAGPEQAKFVTSDGTSAPVITDGRSPRPRNCSPDTGSWMSSRPSGRSRSRPGSRRHPARTVRRSARPSRC